MATVVSGFEVAIVFEQGECERIVNALQRAQDFERKTGVELRAWGYEAQASSMLTQASISAALALKVTEAVGAALDSDSETVQEEPPENDDEPLFTDEDA